jgi:hypothetical protein
MENNYLTQKEIEDFGFILKVKSIHYWFEMDKEKVFDTDLQNFFAYKPYNIFLNYGFNDNYRLKIKADFNGNPNWDNADTLFEGECKTLQDLKTILTYIHILPFYEPK